MAARPHRHRHKGVTPLHYACEFTPSTADGGDNTELVEALIALGARVNESDKKVSLG